MADTKLADLTALTTPSGDDILYVVDDPAGTPLDRKIALDNLFKRGTVTTSSPVIDAAQTWDDGGANVTFTGLKFNATDTASAAGSLLMDLQVGGTSEFTIDKLGNVRANDGLRTNVAYGPLSKGNTGFYFPDTGTTIRFAVNGGVVGLIDSTRFVFSGDIGFASTSLNAAYTVDTFITRRAAANLRLGAADAAAPVAQTLSVQSVVAGQTNVAGANLTITGSQGTGTGAGGSIVFQVAPAGSSGTAQNALADALTIASTRAASFAAGVSLPTAGPFNVGTILYANSTKLMLYVTNPLCWGVGNADSGAYDTSVSRNSAGVVQVGTNTTNASGSLYAATIGIGSNSFLASDAANTLALRNGANAQAFRVYNTYTSATDFERGNIFWDSNVLKIGTEKGSAGGTDRAVYLASNSNIYLENGGFLRWGMVGTDPNFIALRNTGGLKFSSSTSFPGTPDVGIARSGTNTLKITNGSTGTGALESASLKTDAPAGGTAATWKLGTVASVSPTLPNRTIEVEIGGTTYYISAKTTND